MRKGASQASAYTMIANVSLSRVKVNTDSRGRETGESTTSLCKGTNMGRRRIYHMGGCGKKKWKTYSSHLRAYTS